MLRQNCSAPESQEAERKRREEAMDKTNQLKTYPRCSTFSNLGPVTTVQCLPVVHSVMNPSMDYLILRASMIQSPLDETISMRALLKTRNKK